LIFERARSKPLGHDGNVIFPNVDDVTFHLNPLAGNISRRRLRCWEEAMRFSVLLVGIVALFVAVGPGLVSRAVADDAATCADASGDEAIAACTRAINSGRFQGRALAELYSNRCDQYRANGDLDRAIADCNEAIRLNPNDASAYHNRGTAYNDKGDSDRAIDDFNRAIRLDPKLAQPFNGRGNAYYDKRDFDRAIADYNEAIRLNLKYANAYYNRGLTKRAKGDASGGDADIAKAKQLNPDVGN
jgi:tetratricopeptide (TPR) repeat protein